MTYFTLFYSRLLDQSIKKKEKGIKKERATHPARRDPEIRINHLTKAHWETLSITWTIGLSSGPSRRGRRNYPVNAHRPAGLLITTNLPVSLRRKQVPHKFYPVYGGDAIMTTKLAQINYARTCRVTSRYPFLTEVW